METASAAMLVAAHGLFAPNHFVRFVGCVHGLFAMATSTWCLPLRRIMLLLTTSAYHVQLDPDSALDAAPLTAFSMVIDLVSLAWGFGGTEAFVAGYVVHVARLYWIAGVPVASPVCAAIVAMMCGACPLDAAARIAAAAALPGVGSVAKRSLRFRYLT